MRFGRGIPLGKFFGIAVTLDLSWVIVSILMAWNLRDIFAHSVPGRANFAYTLTGALGAVLFFACLLAHELSHAVMARRKGIEVAEITLFLFGGVAKIKSDPVKPGDEFKIAAVGPAMSVLLGAGLFGLGVIAEAARVDMTAAVFQVIGVLNLVLAGFNLLPGFPLDGGRILRSAIWRVTGDVVKATKASSLVGRFLAGALVAFGVWRIWRGDLGGLWTVLLGVFLNAAAVGSYRSIVMKKSIDGVTVGQLMDASPSTIAGNATVMEALDRFASTTTDAFAVTGYGGQLEGIITLQALRERVDASWMTVRQIMVPVEPAIVASPEEPVSAVLERIGANPVGRFLVLSGERLVGMVSATDIAKFLQWRTNMGSA